MLHTIVFVVGVLLAFWDVLRICLGTAEYNWYDNMLRTAVWVFLFSDVFLSLANAGYGVTVLYWLSVAATLLGIK